MSKQRTESDVRQEQGRSVEKTIEIDAPVDAVWAAISDAKELMRWFPPQARSTPGLGGSIWMCWEGFYESDGRIDVWEPERHLRITGFPQQLATDYYLEGKGGTTVLRVVTSGFGPEESWDEMVEGVRCGWDFELRSLRHYLEHHRGQDRIVAWARAHYNDSHQDVWPRLVGSGGWFAGPSETKIGKRYDVTTATSDDLAGTLLVWDPPRQLVVTVEKMNNALLRVELFGEGDDATATIWLSAYGVPAGDVASLERKWREYLKDCLSA
jgi:uncharacterized protein YndB with AHSA1/START domain